jgi:hypothetical protein
MGTDGYWPMSRMKMQVWQFRRVNCAINWEYRYYGEATTPDVAWYHNVLASNYDWNPVGACQKRQSHITATFWDDGRTPADPASYIQDIQYFD